MPFSVESPAVLAAALALVGAIACVTFVRRVAPAREEGSGAAVTRLELRGADGREAAAEVSVSGPPRELTIEGTTTAATRPVRVGPGRVTVVRPLGAGASGAAAQFSGGDEW